MSWAVWWDAFPDECCGSRIRDIAGSGRHRVFRYPRFQKGGAIVDLADLRDSVDQTGFDGLTQSQVLVCLDDAIEELTSLREHADKAYCVYCGELGAIDW